MNSEIDQHYDLELRIAKLLRYGVILSLILLVIGWTGQIFQGHELSMFQTYQLTSLKQNLLSALNQQHYFLLISYLGLGVLISLPIIRVFFTGVLFIKQKEKVLAGLAFFVLLALLVSFSLGIEI